jgi:hypothetical protein
MHRVAPTQRGDERCRESCICVARNRRLERAVGRRGDRLSLLQGPAGQSAVGWKLEAEGVLRQPLHGRAAQDVPVGVEQVAVGGVDPEQLGDLLDQPLEHRLELQVARESLRGAKQTVLLDHPSPFALERRLPQDVHEPCGRRAACCEPDCEPHDERCGSDRGRSAEPQSVGCLCH